LAVFDGWTRPLLTAGLILVLELVSNNVLEPLLYGASIAFALLVAAVFWTWLWGIAGLMLSAPLTVYLVVMGKCIPQLEFLSEGSA
jgi:predicted PurR-regulated permease PerM